MSTNSADEAYLKIRQEAVNEKCGFLKGTEWRDSRPFIWSNFYLGPLLCGDQEESYSAKKIEVQNLVTLSL